MVTPQAYWYLLVATKTLSWQVCNTNSTEIIISLLYLTVTQDLLCYVICYALWVIYIAELGFRVGWRKIIYGQLILEPF